MEDIPLDNGQWSEGVFVVINGSLELVKYQGMAMSTDSDERMNIIR